MSQPHALEAQPKNSDKAQESGNQAMAHVAAHTWQPTEAAQAKQPKTEPHAIDFNKAGDIYASKAAAPQYSTGDPNLVHGGNTASDTSPANTMSSTKPAENLAGAHTMTDAPPANTMGGGQKPAENSPPNDNGKSTPEITKTQPLVMPNIYDFSNPKSQGQEKELAGAPGSKDDPSFTPYKPDPSDKPASPSRPPAPDKPSTHFWDLWGSEITSMMGLNGG